MSLCHLILLYRCLNICRYLGLTLISSVYFLFHYTTCLITVLIFLNMFSEIHFDQFFILFVCTPLYLLPACLQGI